LSRGDLNLLARVHWVRSAALDFLGSVAGRAAGEVGVDVVAEPAVRGRTERPAPQVAGADSVHLTRARAAAGSSERIVRCP